TAEKVCPICVADKIGSLSGDKHSADRILDHLRRRPGRIDMSRILSLLQQSPHSASHQEVYDDQQNRKNDEPPHEKRLTERRKRGQMVTRHYRRACRERRIVVVRLTRKA